MTRTNQNDADEQNIVLACPRCDSAEIGVRSARFNRLNDGNGRYRCGNCCHIFNEGVNRPSRQRGGGRKGLAGKLARIGEQRTEEASTP